MSRGNRSSFNEDQIVKPQFDGEAEQSVIGSILIDKKAFEEVASIVSPEDFYFEEHRWIVKAMQSLVAEDFPTDIVSVKSKLEDMGKLEFVGGVTYLARLADSVPTSANASYYARIVKEKSLCRKAQRIGEEIERLAVSGNLKEAKKKSAELERLAVFENDIPFSDMFTEEDFERISKSKRFYSKHLSKLTHIIPFIRGEDIYIVGRTSTGKTQMAINLAQDFLDEGAKVGYVSCEMGKEQMMIRLLNWEFGGDETPMWQIDIRDRGWWNAGKGLLKQEKFRNFYFFEKSSDFDDIVNWIDSHNFDVVFIDYIQLLRDKNYAKLGRNAEIGAIARRIRQEISKKRCVVVMSQMNRLKLDEPDLSQIRDSGEIEQTATGIVFIERGKDETGHPEFKYRIMKNQTYGGLSGWIHLKFSKTGQFEEDS